MKREKGGNCFSRLVPGWLGHAANPITRPTVSSRATGTSRLAATALPPFATSPIKRRPHALAPVLHVIPGVG